MRAMLTAAAALAWLAAAPSGVGADARWATYVNDRFGTSLSYPADVFAVQPPPDNDDGRTLVAADGSKILVFGGYNVDNETLASKRAGWGWRRLRADRPTTRRARTGSSSPAIARSAASIRSSTRNTSSRPLQGRSTA